jgi:hypothetical protein
MNQGTYEKGIHLGMPVRCYHDGGMEAANLFADLVLSLLLPIVGFNGAVMLYQGSYWPALWVWLFSNEEDWS